MVDDVLNIICVWNQFYSVIYQVNSLLERIEFGVVVIDDVVVFNCIKVEVFVLCGLVLFDFICLFVMFYILNNGIFLGVFIEIKMILFIYQFVCNMVVECYQQVIDDMIGVLKFLVFFVDKKNGYFNVWSVKVLFLWVYFYMNDNEKVFVLVKEVMNNGGLYQLFIYDEYFIVWGKDFSFELLFEFYYIFFEFDGGMGGEGVLMVYVDNVKDWNNFVLIKVFFDLLGEDLDDVCYLLNCLLEKLEEDILFEGFKGYFKYLNKYLGKIGDNLQDNDICIICFFEVYLNVVEVVFKLGGVENLKFFLDCFNVIVSCVNFVKFVKEMELSLECILKECCKELVGEGYVFFDVMCNGLFVSCIGGWYLFFVVVVVVISLFDLWVVLFILQVEIDVNLNMV